MINATLLSNVYFSFCHFLFAQIPFHFICLHWNRRKWEEKKKRMKNIIKALCLKVRHCNEAMTIWKHEGRRIKYSFKTNLMAKIVWWICFWWPSPLVPRWQSNNVLCINLSLLFQRLSGIKSQEHTQRFTFPDLFHF